MEIYENLILQSLNAKTPKEAFEKIEQMRRVLEKCHITCLNYDSIPESKCSELYSETKNVLDIIRHVAIINQE